MAQVVNVNFRMDEESADPFYSESNMKYLEKVISDIEDGRAKLVEHNLMEADENGKGDYKRCYVSRAEVGTSDSG